MRSDDSPTSEQPGELQVPEVESTFRLGLTKAHGEEADPAVELGDDGDASSSRLQSLSKSKTSVRYVLKGEIGRGGMGVILKVFDKDLRRNLAMKVILGKTGAESGETTAVDPAMLSRFLEEAQVTSQLDHPGVVPVHELGVDSEGRVYFTMRLVRGQTLKEIFDNVQASAEGWNQVRALGVLMKVCEAMAYAHDKGVIHRDLKPTNVMVGKYGEVYVMDWGLARVEGREDTRDLRWEPSVESLSQVRTDRREERDSDIDSPLVTMDGAVVGTPAYMSREQALGQTERVDRRSDVYSVGAMLYQLLTGCVPYVPPGARMSGRTIHMRVIDGPPKPVRDVAQSLPPVELEAICEKAMARDSAARYADMGELGEDLRAFIEGRVVQAHRTGAVVELKKWVARNKALAGAVAAGLLVLVAGLITSLVLKTQSDYNYALAEEGRTAADEARSRADDNYAQSERRSYTAFLLAAEAARKEGNNAEARRLHALCPEKYRGWEWGHLGLQLDCSSKVLEGDTSGIRVVSISPDGRSIVSHSFDETVRVWNIETGSSIRLERLAVPEGGVSLLAFREEGRSIIAVTDDRKALPNHRGYRDPPLRPTSELWGGRYRGPGVDQRMWCTWNAESGENLSDGGEVVGKPLGLGPEGRFIALRRCYRMANPSRAWGVSVYVLDTTTNEEVLLQETSRTVVDERGNDLPDSWTVAMQANNVERRLPFRPFAFSLDGRRVASRSVGGLLQVWDVESGGIVRELEGPEGAVSVLCLSSNGEQLVFALEGGALGLWDTNPGTPLLVLEGHAEDATSAAFSPDDRRVVSGARDSTLRLWDADTGEALGVWNGHGSWVEALAFTPDGNRVISGSLDGSIRIWEAVPGGPEHFVQGPTSLGWGGDSSVNARWDAVAFSPGGRLVVSAEKPHSTEGARESRHVWPEVRVWDLTTRETVHVLEGHTWGVGALAFSPDGGRIASASDDQTVRVWSVGDGQCLQVFREHSDSVSSVAFSPDGQYVVSSCQARFPRGGSIDVRLWDSWSGEQVRAFLIPGERSGRYPAYSLAFSGDGEFLAAGTRSSVIIWNVRTDAKPRILPHEQTSVGAVTFSPDGRRLVSGSWDHKVRIWDLETDTLLEELEGHSVAVERVLFSPRGDRILSSGDAIRVWDAETFETLCSLDAPESVAIAFNGKRVLAASKDCTVLTWESGLSDSIAFGRAGQKTRDVNAILESLWRKHDSFDQVMSTFERMSDSVQLRNKARNLALWRRAVNDDQLIQGVFRELYLERDYVIANDVAEALENRPELPERVRERAREFASRRQDLTVLNRLASKVVNPEGTREGDRARALEYARAAVSGDEESADFRITLAWALIANGHYDDGFAAAKRALELAPERNKTYSNFLSTLEEWAWRIVNPVRGVDGTGEGDRARALVYARAAVSGDEESANFRDTLAWAFFANGDYDDAIAASEKALELADDWDKPDYREYLDLLREMIKEARGR